MRHCRLCGAGGTRRLGCEAPPQRVHRCAGPPAPHANQQITVPATSISFLNLFARFGATAVSFARPRRCAETFET
eukprot:1778631-Prymnesium_polylepis.1